MKFLFDDESFSFEALRAAGFAAYDGAELGEVLVTAAKIGDGDEAAWHAAWKATAERVEDLGRTALAAGHEVSAREALLRASNYYRTAEFFLREHPATDPEVTELSTRSHDTFAQAAALFDSPVEAVEIPYEDTTLPGYLFRVDDSGAPRPTVVYTSGFDSTLEEAYFALAAGALRRGYNVLAFDGPGQGAALRRQQLVFRPDWEAVTTPVLDYAVSRPEIDDDRIAVFGYSMGGYLVARAAAFEHRIAALILDDGVHDLHAAFYRSLPPALTGWIDEQRDDVANPVLGLIASANTQVRWALNNGKWTMGVDSAAALVRRSRDYTLTGIADRITAPTLIMDAENDQFFAGQPQKVEQALVNAPTTLVTLTEAEGAGEHCHMGAMSRAHQTMFDWLDDTLPTA
ncbi:alpha/beta fold hydrolase [Amycolatopsis sp. NBC_00345]|uniref:alpha/beta hydrolase family protein n=1 Tax=Amycolatopsis sp. NBC_00345 TaxID=2975955 RepID=UPI002E2711E0